MGCYISVKLNHRVLLNWQANINRISLPTKLNRDFNAPPSPCLDDRLNPSRAFDIASDSIDLPRHAVGLISKAPLGPSVEANPRNPKLEKSTEKYEHKINWKIILESCAGAPKCYTTEE